MYHFYKLKDMELGVLVQYMIYFCIPTPEFQETHMMYFLCFQDGGIWKMCNKLVFENKRDHIIRVIHISNGRKALERGYLLHRMNLLCKLPLILYQSLCMMFFHMKQSFIVLWIFQGSHQLTRLEYGSHCNPESDCKVFLF